MPIGLLKQKFIQLGIKSYFGFNNMVKLFEKQTQQAHIVDST